MIFRKLKAEEVEARVSVVTEKGCSLLIYKDSRVDQRLLDETVGAMNWQRSHEVVGGNLYCTVSIYDPEKGVWVSKQDVGTESYTEKEKGQASDSFKRACFNWGIGRELYTAPFIWIGAENVKIYQSANGKPTTKDRFKVSEIGYDGDAICYLTIEDSKGNIVYQYGAQGEITSNEKKRLQAMCKRAGLDYNETFPNGVLASQYAEAVKRLNDRIEKLESKGKN